MDFTTMCYIENDGAYLMLHRIKQQDDINAGKWIGVGGHFEGNESPEECILREIAEETGVTVTEICCKGYITFADDAYSEGMFVFTAKAASRTVKECDEGVLAWIPKEQVLLLPLWQGDKVFLPLLAEPGFFTAKLIYKNGELTESTINTYRN